MKVMTGDSVLIDSDRDRIGIVLDRDGKMLRLRLPAEGTSEKVHRDRLEPVAEVLADKVRKGVKYSNDLSHAGNSTIADLVQAFGYTADQRLQQATLDKVIRQLSRAGIFVDAETYARDDVFRLLVIEDDFPDEDDGPTTAAHEIASVVLPDVSWLRALGLPSTDELRFLRALPERDPVLCLLALPEASAKRPWFAPTWEGLLSWSYSRAQQFVRERDYLRDGYHPVKIAAPAVLEHYLRPSPHDEKELDDGPRHMTLVTLDKSIDDHELARIAAFWPGAVFRFEPEWLRAADVAKAPEFASLVRTLCIVGGKPRSLEGSLESISPLQLLLWAKDSVRQMLAAATVGFGGLLTERKLAHFRGSNETSTALALKAVVAQWLDRRKADLGIEFEDEEAFDGDEEYTRRADVHAPGFGLFEVETMNGSGPIEDFYHRKVFSRVDKAKESFYLVVPSDSVLWCGAYLADIAHRLGDSGKVLIPRAREVAAEDDEQIAVELVAIEGSPLERYSVRISDPREGGAAAEPKPSSSEGRTITLDDIAGYEDIKKIVRDDVVYVRRHPVLSRTYNGSGGMLFFGPPGCGKSWLARAISGSLGHQVRLLGPADLRGIYVGWGQRQIRDQFDWLASDESRVLIIDEFDAVARSRRSINMHSDEQASVNELLTQLDRAGQLGRLVMCTTNFVRSLDDAVLRGGRFSTFVPVRPPDVLAATEIVRYYLERQGLDRAGNRIEGLTVSAPNADAIRELISEVSQQRSQGRARLCCADYAEAVAAAFREAARTAFGERPWQRGQEYRIELSADLLLRHLLVARPSITEQALRTFADEVQQYCRGEVKDSILQQLGTGA